MQGGLRPRELHHEISRKMDGVIDRAEGSELYRSAGEPIEDRVGFTLRPHLAEIVHSHIPSKAAAVKRLGEATGDVVLFHHQHRITGSGQCRGTSEATDAGTDDDRVPRVLDLASCNSPRSGD